MTVCSWPFAAIPSDGPHSLEQAPVGGEKTHSFAMAICLSLQGGQAVEVVETRERWLHLRYFKLVDKCCGHAIA